MTMAMQVLRRSFTLLQHFKKLCLSRSLSRTLTTTTTTTTTTHTKKQAILRVHGPDRKGIVASVSQVLDQYGCAIQKSEQWTDVYESLFFQRVEFSQDDAQSSSSTSWTDATRHGIAAALDAQCANSSLTIRINWRQRKTRVAIFVSKYDHCLWELLLRHEAHELDCEIVAVVSNHDKLRHVAATFGIPYHVFDITLETKQAFEQEQLDLLQELEVDLVILARYMQVLSSHFLQNYPNDCILNIHHSFLPAFAGGAPYTQAYHRGVKIIGATAHYVTPELDAGPIIEQDVLHVSHRDTVARMRQKGRIIERNVLMRAVRAHLEDRVIRYQNRCVVFGD